MLLCGALVALGFPGYLLYVDGPAVAWLLSTSAMEKFFILDVNVQFGLLVAAGFGALAILSRILGPRTSSSRYYETSTPEKAPDTEDDGVLEPPHFVRWYD
ncbi:MAG: hypothetical protein AAB955_02335 [Patescibacteria group bacterium]